LSEDQKIEIAKTNERFSENGLRVLAFAKKEIDTTNITVEDERDLQFIGLIAMMDPPREESKQAVKECDKAGIKTIMITGDHKVTAAAIAKEIGILKDGTRAVEGSEIDELSDEELKNFVEDVRVYARVSPEHKIRIVRAWQEKGNIVSMTGDGVNDAPALKQADVGVAMGITGTEVSKDASSMVLTDDNFATIVKAIENGRNVYANIKRSILFLLSGNTAGIFAILYASLMALPVPFEPVHLLFINLLTDSLPAIALGLEPHSKHVMEEKPRPMNEPILTRKFMTNIITEGIVITITTMAAYYVGLNNGGAGAASTMAFATLCLGRLVHGFNCKSDRAVIFTKRFNNNPYLWGAFGIGFVLLNAVLLIPGLNNTFRVSPLTIPLLLTIYGLALMNLVIIQIMKVIKTALRKK
jgi:Ca2+-transporting ATPase